MQVCKVSRQISAKRKKSSRREGNQLQMPEQMPDLAIIASAGQTESIKDLSIQGREMSREGLMTMTLQLFFIKELNTTFRSTPSIYSTQRSVLLSYFAGVISFSFTHGLENFVCN